MVNVLDEKLRLEIYDLLTKAKAEIESDKKDRALVLCEQAWALFPEPKAQWDVSEVVLRAMVIRLRAIGEFEKAVGVVGNFLESVSDGYDYYGPSFFLGTLYFEMGNLDRAFHFFNDANKKSRGRCFQEEDKKYKDFFKNYRSS